jgi:hypothetical protein
MWQSWSNFNISVSRISDNITVKVEWLNKLQTHLFGSTIQITSVIVICCWSDRRLEIATAAHPMTPDSRILLWAHSGIMRLLTDWLLGSHEVFPSGIQVASVTRIGNALRVFSITQSLWHNEQCAFAMLRWRTGAVTAGRLHESFSMLALCFVNSLLTSWGSHRNLRVNSPFICYSHNDRHSITLVTQSLSSSN